jgi:uncharacterized protein
LESLPKEHDCRSISTCDAATIDQLRRAIARFNAGRYFDCHETLEELWLAERDLLRYLYQGLLQIAVALHHLQRGNERGARSLLAKGITLLAAFPSPCLGVDLTALLAGARELTLLLDDAGLAAAQDRLRHAPPRISLVAGAHDGG